MHLSVSRVPKTNYENIFRIYLILIKCFFNISLFHSIKKYPFILDVLENMHKS